MSNTFANIHLKKKKQRPDSASTMRVEGLFRFVDITTVLS